MELSALDRLSGRRVPPPHRRTVHRTAHPTLPYPGPWEVEKRPPTAGSRISQGAAAEKLRRSLNVVVALVGIVLTLPLALVIAALIKLTSPGPVFYTQPRVGLHRRRSRDLHSFRLPENGRLRENGGTRENGRSNGHPRPPGERRDRDLGGRPFRIYKFRTMTDGADKSGEVWASQDDPRVTPVGRFLRCTRLDELPQLLNVLKGDMNVVGPRPEQPRIFADLREEIPGYELRQTVLPGITGWAQVNHTYDQCVEDVKTKLVYDLDYLSRCSATLDLRIMLRTPAVMLGRTKGW